MEGISRSGRIRKKSSKLRDYQAPDDWDGKRGRVSESHDDSLAGGDASVATLHDSSSTSHIAYNPGASDSFNAAVPGRSIYMSEKSSKKSVVMKDGSVQLKRQPRKDKGRTRLTAYMLWSRSVRDQMGDLDFAARSQRLGELWANVPTSERLLWKRRVATYNKNQAKQAAKAKADADKAAMAAAKGLAMPTANSNNSRSRGVTTTAQHTSGRSTATNDRRSRQTVNTAVDTPVTALECTDPTNIAAHLKLLGDSLYNIGDSLQQHETDQGGDSITINGTVSVLLDSLLCSLVPLLSLTQHVDGLKDAPGDGRAPLKDILQDTLDNIAYVMPGLPISEP